MFVLSLWITADVYEYNALGFTGHTGRRFRKFERYPSPRLCSSATPTRTESSSFINTSDINSLDEMTVKELKEVLMENGLNERGLSSKLTRKQDVLDYLNANLPSSKSQGTSTTVNLGDDTLNTFPKELESRGIF